MKNFIRISYLLFALGYSGLAAPHKLRVDDPVLSKELVSQGATVIGDYGAFTVLNADDALLANGISNRVEIADDWNLIRLNAQALDTRAPAIKALRQIRGSFTGKRLHLVQFAGPIKPHWLAELKGSGVQIVSYIPENTYLVYGDAAALSRLQAWAGASAFTQWEGEYRRGFKVHPTARALAVRGSNGKFPITTFAIQLLADTNANPATMALIDQLKTAPLQLDFRMEPYCNVVVSLSSDQLDTIAAQPDVISIQEFVQPKKRDERQDQIVAGNLNGTVPSGPGYLAWLASKGFTQAQFDASGFVVDVADSGIDNGSLAPGHFGLYPLGDIAQPSRVAYVQVGGTLNPGGTLAGCDGHGTLNSHIIGNYDAFTGFQHQDRAGFSYGIGVCPFVKIGSSVIFDNSDPNNDFTNPDFSKMASDAYASGARIGNNSWGSDAKGHYDFVSQTYDMLVRDAQASVNGNQEMSFAFAAGNAGPCTSPKSSQGIDSPASAKNVIAVGASENVRFLSIADGGNDPNGSDACAETDATADSADDMDCGSSRGPCSDGRMKPDLVAPGIHITGGVPQSTPPPLPTGMGLAISCFNAAGVCALPGSGTTSNANNFFPLGQQFYTESSGTSHSTPVVAGACALIRQYFINNGWDVPSPAMTKAFLINSARYLTGVGANDTLWSRSQGMGEVNLGVAFDGVPRFLRDQVSADKFTGTGQRRAYIGQVVDSTKPFRVTIAWTDAPGNTTGAAYNNNLDLKVIIGGNTYKGNVFKGQYSATGGKADARNNVENVFLPAGVTGDFTIIVTAANINSDGVPNEAPSLDQDFALVIYNGNATTGQTTTPMAANYSGLFYESGGVDFGHSGAISLSTTISDSYSGKLQMGAKSYPFSGMFDPFGTTTNAVLRKGASTLGLSLTINLNDSNFITGTITDPGSWTADVRAVRTAASANAAALAGNYTLVFPGTNGSAQLPAGDGYATVTVSTAGKIKLKGSLADGSPISQNAALLADGEWAFYDSLYAGQGQMLGWLAFTNSVSEDLGGDVSWFKPVQNAKLYPAGFDFITHAIGSIYNPAATPLIDFSSGVVILSGGNLANPITTGVSVSGTSVSSTNGLSLKISAAKGTLKGSVANPAGKGTIPFNGVLLQNQGIGTGYFPGTNQSGRAFFGPAN